MQSPARNRNTLPTRNVVEMMSHMRCKAETTSLLAQQTWTVQPLFAELNRRELYADAVRLLAMALPKRAAVWWAALVAWDLYREPLAETSAAWETEQAALSAAVDWVRCPAETTRRAAEQAGRAAEAKTATGALAMAAAWSDGSLSLPGLPVVPPAWFLTGKLTAGSILLTAAYKRPYELHYNYRRYLSLGVEIAAGRLCWPTIGEHEEAVLLQGESANAARQRECLFATAASDASQSQYYVDAGHDPARAPHPNTVLAAAREQLVAQLAYIDRMLIQEELV